MTRTILLADDSVTIQKVVELTLMDEDYKVSVVGDGDAALAKLGEFSPSFVIADVHMPGANGYEVCRKSKELLPGVPVLLLVGSLEPFDEHEANLAGADGHLKKPFDSQDLLRMVEELSVNSEGVESGSEEVAGVSEDSSKAGAGVAAAAFPGRAGTADGEGSDSRTPSLSHDDSSPTLSEEDVDRIARKVADLIGDRLLREVAWEVMPDLAEIVIKERIRELEAQVE